MPCAPLNVANNILQRAFHDEIAVTPMKLQKILFFAAAEYAKATGEPLLSEQFEPWPYGPVLRSVHTKFKPFGGEAIDRYAKDAKGYASIVDEALHPQLVGVLDTVWDATKKLPPVTLARITHLPGSAWHHATQARQPAIENQSLAEDRTYAVLLGL